MKPAEALHAGLIHGEHWRDWARAERPYVLPTVDAATLDALHAVYLLSRETPAATERVAFKGGAFKISLSIKGFEIPRRNSSK
jgi:hypothetical protein